jgi:hypothetical protein
MNNKDQLIKHFMIISIDIESNYIETINKKLKIY